MDLPIKQGKFGLKKIATAAKELEPKEYLQPKHDRNLLECDGMQDDIGIISRPTNLLRLMSS